MAKKPPAKRTPVPATTGRPAGLFTWLAIGLVVVVVAALVIIKVATGSSSGGSTAFQPASATEVSDLASVPASVFNKVGVTSSVVPISPPIPLKNQPALTGKVGATTLPEVFYLGAEYCPFCAAERWPTIVALSRFGTFSNLGDMTSSTKPGEAYPGTPTFTFLKAHYASKYLVLKTVEQYTNVWDNATGFYGTLQTPSAQEAAVFKKYDTSSYIPGITSTQDYSIPFVSIGNKYLISGASFTPQLLAGISRATIAAGLSDPTNPVTVAIVATANYETAAFCQLTKNQPGSVCASPGVMAAKKALGIK